MEICVFSIIISEFLNMKRFAFSTILILSFTFCVGQTDSITTKIERTKSIYSDILHNRDRIYAINISGQVVIWDLLTLDTISFSHNDTSVYKFLCLAKDRNNNVHFGTDKGHIFKYDSETAEPHCIRN